MALGAFGIGLSKTGIAGFGVVAVALFAVAVPAKLSTGIVLPLLIVGDITAVSIYRRKAVWIHLTRLFPWTAIGVVVGYFALGRISDTGIAHLIGGILITLAVIQIVRRRNTEVDPQLDALATPVRQTAVFMAVMGILAGFTTMVANAAGPIMVLYLLATRLPKVEFIGTAAWFFFILNAFKVPFSIRLGLINFHSLPVDAVLAPVVIVGGLIGRALLQRIDQKLFENLAITLTVVAALKLLL